MKNLQLLYCGSFIIPWGVFAVDADTGDVWLISESLKLLCFKELGLACKEHADLALEASLESCRDIVSFDFVLDLESAYFALRNGEIYKFSVDVEELDNVGSVACGLECAVWSPDQEILVLVSKEGKVIMLSKNCEPISECSLLTGDFGEASPVVLGWGKRETQFKGKAGKFADLQDKDGQEPVSNQSNDDKRVRVSWRGDGQFFAVSFVHVFKGVREVKIFTRECSLHATSQSVAGLGQSLSWKPSANLITSNRTSHKEEIVFFEKNGLRYGEFTLPYPVGEYAVREVEWNSNSSILLVLLAPLARNTNTLIQLWTCSNAYWYLKQEICFPAVDTPTLIQWNTIQANTLYILTQSSSFLTYELTSVVSQSSEVSRENDNWLAVIDGSRLLLSPYRSLTVPPPMSSCSIELSRSVIEVVFGRGELRDKLLCLLADCSVVELVHSRSEGNRGDSGFLDKTGSYSLSKVYRFRDFSTDSIAYHQIRHLHWVSGQVLLAISYSPEGKEHGIVLCKIISEENEIIIQSTIVTAKPVLTLTPCSATHSFAVEFTDGEVNLVACSNELLSLEPWVNLPYPSHRIATATFAGKEHILGLTNNGRLFIDEFELCSNATSYFLHSSFLLLTTSNHFLHSLSLSVPLSQLRAILPAPALCASDAVRRVERGAEIVTAVSFASKIVLQMPRGNLEAIHPRSLILAIIGSLLNKRSYAVAFTALRRHRINMNVFHDYNPDLFMNSIPEFITQVYQPQFLNIFISELSDQDICATMYPNMEREGSAVEAGNKVNNKVNSVCDAIIEACERAENTQLYILPIITALIKKSPSQLEEVLLRIKSIPGTSRTSQEDALKYVSLLIDLQQLYSVALGTYDFAVMLLVAQQSNMDPKEYLPFLNNLKSLEENYRKYYIDCHLSKYDSALVHILQCRDREEECLSFITKHELYKRALEEIPKAGGKLFVSVSLSFGDWLFSKEKYSEAGLVYIQVGELQLALKAFRKSSNWQQVMSISHQLSLSKDGMLEVVYEQVGRLRDSCDFVSAARVLCEYTQDYEDAILMLIEANIFNESHRLIHKYSRMDLLETHLKPKLVEAASGIISMLIKSRAEVEKFVDRLNIVLKSKLEKEQNYFEEGGNPRDQDFFSEQSSVTGQSVSSKGSRGSSKSSRSSKNRKKQERKKYRLKEGSSHEDLALLQEIRDIAVRSDQIQDELSTMLELLIISNEVVLARDLQNAARSTLTYLAATIPQTWYKHKLMTVALYLCQEEGVVCTPNLCSGILSVLKEGTLSLTQSDAEISEPFVRNVKWEVDYLLSS